MEDRCSFLKIMGGEKYSDDEKYIGDVRINIFFCYKITAFFSILIYLLILGRKKRKEGSFGKAYRTWVDESVFSFIVKSPTKEDQEQEEESSIISLQEEIQTKENKIDMSRSVNDLEKNSCSLSFIFRIILRKIQLLKDESSRVIKIKGDSIFFFSFCLLPFINMPSIRITSMIFMNDCVLGGDTGKAIYTVIDLFQGAVEFLFRVFTLSFLGTKQEFMKIDAKNSAQRGQILYFNCKKAYILCLLYFFMKILLIIFLNDPVFEHSYGVTTGLFWMMKCVFLLLFSNYAHARKTIPISENDNILKSHKIFFIFQGTLLKYLPSTETIYKSLIDSLLRSKSEEKKLSVNALEYDAVIENLNNDLSKQCIQAEEVLKDNINLVKSQKFKNIIVNNGSNPYYPSFLLHYLVFVDIPMIFLSSAFTMSSQLSILSFAYIFAGVLNTFVILLFPWLNFVTLKTSTIFGSESEDSQLRAGFIKIDKEIINRKSNKGGNCTKPL